MFTEAAGRLSDSIATRTLEDSDTELSGSALPTEHRRHS